MCPRKFHKDTNDDCYFFMYSQCTKGLYCPYRHCVAAKSNKNICRYWLNGCCLKRDCGFRHNKGSITYRKKESENKKGEQFYPMYGVTKLDKQVILPVGSTKCQVKTAIKSAVFSNHMGGLTPYPIEPGVISVDDKDKSESESDLKETEETRLKKILEEPYEFYKSAYSPIVKSNYLKRKPSIYKIVRCTGKRKEFEVPFANKNAKRVKIESSPNFCGNSSANNVPSNSAKEKEIKAASHPVLNNICLSSSASVTKPLEVVEIEKVKQSSEKPVTPAVNNLNSVLVNEEELLLDYEPDNVLP